MTMHKNCTYPLQMTINCVLYLCLIVALCCNIIALPTHSAYLYELLCSYIPMQMVGIYHYNAQHMQQLHCVHLNSHANKHSQKMDIALILQFHNLLLFKMKYFHAHVNRQKIATISIIARTRLSLHPCNMFCILFTQSYFLI